MTEADGYQKATNEARAEAARKPWALHHVCPCCDRLYLLRSRARDCCLTCVPRTATEHAALAAQSREKQAAYAARRRRHQANFRAGSLTPWEDPE